MSLTEIFCQDKGISALQRAYNAGRMPHAYIFAGPDGVGRFKTAEQWAKFLLCQDPVAKESDSGIFNDSCGKCQSCKAGMENMCLKRVGIGYEVDGGFAEYVKVPADMLIPIPEDISFEEASLMDICVAVHAVQDRSSLRKNDHVVIMGPGFLGLSILQLCKLRGAASVIIVGIEKDAKRLKLAKELGADEVVQIEKTDLMRVVQSWINTAEVDGVDVVFEVSGSENALASAIRVVRRGGSMTLIGSLPGLVKAPIVNAINRQVTMYGSRAYTRKNCEQAFEYLSDGKIKLQPMISGKFPLEKWKKAFELLQEGEAVKVILQP